MTLNPFDPEATCPKCGHGDIATTYHEEEVPLDPCWNRVEGEHHDRYCRRCGYEWCEAVLQEKQ